MPNRRRTEFELFSQRWKERGLPNSSSLFRKEFAKFAAELREDDRRSQRAEADRDARFSATRDLKAALATSRRQEVATERRRGARLSARLDQAAKAAFARDRNKRRKALHRM